MEKIEKISFWAKIKETVKGDYGEVVYRKGMKFRLNDEQYRDWLKTGKVMLSYSANHRALGLLVYCDVFREISTIYTETEQLDRDKVNEYLTQFK